MSAETMTNSQLRRSLLRIAKPVLPPLSLSTLFRCLQLLCGIALVAVPAYALGLSIEEGDAHLGAVLIAMVALSLGKGLFRYLEQFCGHYVAFRALAMLRLYFYDRLAPQAPAATEGKDSGDLLSRGTKDVDRVEVFFAHTIAPLVSAVVLSVGIVLWFGVCLSWKGAELLAAGFLMAGAFVPMLGSTSSARAARILRRTRGRVAGQVTDSVQGVREVLAFGAQDLRLESLAAAGKPLGKSLRTLGNWQAIRRGLNTVIVALTVVGLFAVLAPLESPTILLVGLAVGLTGFAPALGVEDFAADLQQAYASARRLLWVTEGVEPLPPAQPRSAQLSAPEIRFSNLTFSYPGSTRPALESVSFDCPSGQLTAVVGASGSGKSTLGVLLERVWDAAPGAIELDGRDLGEFDVEQLRAEIGLAAQRPYLFNTSIRENLRMARPDATDAELLSALATADLDLPLETEVGESGEKLSGGQRQRLALARTMLRDPSVLILDEVTSQLDSETEARVLHNLKTQSQGKTVLLIAHRLSTVKEAAKIVVMDGGHVVQEGRYEELAAQPGPFSELLARE
ncbi:MAG: thiol reductant ABC exporter subunit CydC [Propionibacteriaceae bacterium]|jgi:thiol reductant ABC exporter CydC subunit|nr:thiol reductant ABC exporter subunit CydC [Propionibacteriaceae bacterium]